MWAAGKRQPGAAEGNARDDMRAWGATDAQITEALGPEPEPDADAFEVWPENVPVVEVFLACASKWTSAPMGGFTGLDDARMNNVLRYKRVRDKLAMFENLRIMEAAALPVLNERDAS